MENTICHFVDAIKSYIQENNMTPTSFSRQVGVLDTSVARWISGEIMPSLENVIKVADYMKCSLDYLFNLTDKIEKTSPSLENLSFAERFTQLFSESKRKKVDIARACGVDSSAVAKWLYRGQFPNYSL